MNKIRKANDNVSKYEAITNLNELFDDANLNEG